MPLRVLPQVLLHVSLRVLLHVSLRLLRRFGAIRGVWCPRPQRVAVAYAALMPKAQRRSYPRLHDHASCLCSTAALQGLRRRLH